MNVDAISFLYYAGFAVLGWWLRHRGVLAPASAPTPPVHPGTIDQQTLLDLLKSLLDRLVPPPAGGATGGSQVFHVPIEVAANPRAPVAGPG